MKPLVRPKNFSCASEEAVKKAVEVYKISLYTPLYTAIITV